MRDPFRYFNSSPEVIRLTVMMYIRYPLSLRQVEDLLFESGELKAKVALEAFRGDRTLQEIASKHQVHPTQVSAWKRQAIDGLGDVFSNGIERRRRDHEGEIRDLHAKIGELTVERDFLSRGSGR